MAKYFEKILKHDFIIDMSNFLMKRGFNPTEALKVSEDFYNKHKKKLMKVF